VAHRSVNLVGNVQNVAVRNPALRPVSVEQRPTRLDAQDESEFPRQVVAVVQARVEPLPAERARQVGGVADQEPPAVRQARDDPSMHPERREPGDVGGFIFPAEAYPDPSDDVFDGYGLHLLFQVLETDPAPAREWREQQQAVRTADDAGLVPRQRRPHREVSDEEMTPVGGTLEWLPPPRAGGAPRPPPPP